MIDSEARQGDVVRYAVNGVLWATIAGCGALLAWSLTRAGGGLGVAQIATFYLLPAVACTVLALTLRATLERRAAVALVLCGSGVGVVAAESTLALLDHFDVDGVEAWDDTESMFEVLMDLRREGEHAYPTVPGNIFVLEDLTLLGSDGEEIHPLAPGPAGELAVMCDETGTPVTYRADRFGFNNPDEAWDADSIDVVFIGDSFTQGLCVPYEDQAASRLRDRRSVLNLGARGAGPLQQLGILREFGSRVTPPVVVWTYFEGNDLWDLRFEEERAWLTDYLDPTHTQALAERQSDIHSGLTVWLDSLVAEQSLGAAPSAPPSLTATLRSIPRLRRVRELAGYGVIRPGTTVMAGLPEILDRAQADVESWGGRLVLVYMPAYGRYAVRFGEGLPGRRELRAYAERSGIPFVDLDSVFSASRNPKELWAVAGGHLNREGYRLTAEAVAERLDRPDR